MQAILYSSDVDHTRFREHFPDMSMGELPLAGKGVCRHLVDLCGKLGATDVLLADRFFSPELAQQLGDGSYWSLRLQYINCARHTSLRQLYELRKKFAEPGEEFLFSWGLMLPDIHDKQEIFRELRETDPDREPADGVCLFRNGKFYECVCPLFRIDSLQSYFDVNFRLLKDPGVYSLPGYSLKAGFGIGRNVAMRPDCDVQPPILILDNVYLDSGVKLKNGAIIGQYSAIDENTEIDHSIVLDNTYIGRNIQLRNKIVRGSRVFDPATGTYIDLEDDCMAADFAKQNPGGTFRPGERLFALLLALIELPLYLLAKFTGIFRRNMPFPVSLRRNYPKYWKVIFGRTQLVRFGSRQDDYVFRYSDLWWPADKSKYEKNMGDVFYYHHRSFSLMVQVAVVSQLKLLLSIHDPFAGKKA